MSRKKEEEKVVEETAPEANENLASEEQHTDVSVEETVSEENAEESPLDALKAENAELQDKILRMAAENQNTRKRLEKSKQEALRYRHQDILRDLADVIDNFERAIESAGESRDFDSFYEGIVMIEKQFSGMLVERYGLEKIGAEGEDYDPAAHEAMMLEESAEVEKDTVKQVYQAGYRLHDRILRPAKVVVARPAAPVANENAEETGE